MGCTGCGDCCQHVPMSLPFDGDMALFFGLRGWQVTPLPAGRMEVVAQQVCRCYEPDPAEDGHHCRIYDQRPQFCRAYLCPEAKETT